MVLSTILSSVLAFVPGFLADYFATKGADHLLNNRQSMVSALQDVIQQSVTEYAENDQRSYGRLLPFYHSSVILEELLKFRLMAASDYNPERLMETLKNEQDVSTPSDQELTDFLSFLMVRFKANPQLEQLEIKENFSAEIFNVSRMVKSIDEKIEAMSSLYQGALEMQWKDRIDAYVRTLEDFKPASALKLLEALEKSLTLSDQKPGINFMAYLDFQKGQCYGFLQRAQEAYQAKIRAYQVVPGNLLYAKNAAICYFRLKDNQNALTIADGILDKDPFDPVGWAIKILVDPEAFETTLSAVPRMVRQDLAFLRHLHTELPNDYKTKLREQNLVPGLERYHIQELTIDNYNLAVFWLNLTIGENYRDFFFDFLHKGPDERPESKLLHKMLETFLGKLEGSEVLQDFTKLRYLAAAMQFQLNPSSERAIKLESAFGQISSPDWFSTLQTANALQLMGMTQRAVDLLKPCPNLTTEGHLLLCFCYHKLGDTDEQIEAAKNYSRSISIFRPHELIMFINLILEMKLRGLLERFTKADFLGDRIYTNPEDGKIVDQFVTMLFDGPSEAIILFLKEIIKYSPEERLIGIIGSGLFAVGEYELALQALAKNLENKQASRELYQYILAQHKHGEDLHELLLQLENWRINLPFNSELLRIEAFLRKDLVDWETVAEIGELFLLNIKDDSAVLTLYLVALHQLNNPPALVRFEEITNNLQAYPITNAKHAITISNLLIIHGHNRLAFEILYPIAIDPKQVEARGSYNNLVFRLRGSDDGILREYGTVEPNHFVKYQLNGQVSYLKMDEASLVHPVYSKFLGKSAGDEIIQKRGIVNILDTFVILRIMNNYLALFDEILEQSDKEPQAGLPFFSIKLQENHPGGILGQFQDLFGEGHKLKLEDRDADFNEYYAGKLSLSELIAKEYKDDFIQGYYNLIQYHKGILSIPRVQIEQRELEMGERFVIDYSSLLILQQMSSFHGTKFPQKFILSSYIFDQLRSKLAMLEHRADTFDTPDPEWGRTSIADDSLDFRKNRISHLKALLGWITENCEVTLSARTIDLVRKSKLAIGETPVIDSAFSTTLLVQDLPGRMLITDDFSYLKLSMLQGSEITTCEDYINRLSDPGDAVDEFVRNRYLNYSPNITQLQTEFHKHLAGQYSNYQRLLENLAIINSRKNLVTMQDFVKQLALNPVLSQEQLHQQATHIFVTTLLGCSEEILSLVRKSFYISFMLLGLKQDWILQAYDDAKQILLKNVDS